MKRLFYGCLLTLLVVCLASAQSFKSSVRLQPTALFAAMQDGAAAASSPDIKGAFPATLERSLDSKKLKEGDPVVCHTAAALHSRSGLLIPSGSKVIGHVTQATARAKGSPDSTLGIVFDKIELSNGKDLPLKGTLQAIGPNLGEGGPATFAAPPSLGGSGANSMGGSSGGPTGGATTPGPSGTQSTVVAGSKPVVTSQSQGALGMKGLELKDSVISSSGKEVKLDNGTQMLIYGEINVPVQ